MAKTTRSRLNLKQVSSGVVPKVHSLFGERLPGLGMGNTDILSQCIDQFFELVTVRYPTVTNLNEIPEKDLNDIATYVIGLAQIFYMNWTQFSSYEVGRKLKRA